MYLKEAGPRLEGIETPGLTAEGLAIDPPWGLILAAIFMGTSCTEAEAAGVAVVSRIEVFPLPGPIPIIGAKKCQIKIHLCCKLFIP